MAELATSARRDAGDRQRALDAAIGQIERDYGPVRLMPEPPQPSHERTNAAMPTYSLGLTR